MEKDWIIITPGVMPAVNASVIAVTGPNDPVALQSPVYPPFWSAINNNGRRQSVNLLKIVDGRFEIDFDDLRQRFEVDGAKAMILCNPHNPGGRVWSKDELVDMGNIVVGAEMCIRDSPKTVAISVVVFLVTIAVTKYVSLGSLLAVWVGFFYTLFTPAAVSEKILVFCLAAIVTYKHKSNITRLISGKELKLGDKERKD